jgi:hypothetical protein
VVCAEPVDDSSGERGDPMMVFHAGVLEWCGHWIHQNCRDADPAQCPCGRGQAFGTDPVFFGGRPTTDSDLDDAFDLEEHFEEVEEQEDTNDSSSSDHDITVEEIVCMICDQGFDMNKPDQCHAVLHNGRSCGHLVHSACHGDVSDVPCQCGDSNPWTGLAYIAILGDSSRTLVSEDENEHNITLGRGYDASELARCVICGVEFDVDLLGECHAVFHSDGACGNFVHVKCHDATWRTTRCRCGNDKPWAGMPYKYETFIASILEGEDQELTTGQSISSTTREPVEESVLTIDSWLSDDTINEQPATCTLCGQRFDDTVQTNRCQCGSDQPWTGGPPS